MEEKFQILVDSFSINLQWLFAITITHCEIANDILNTVQNNRLAIF